MDNVNSQRPNILLLSVDAFRADRASFLGYERPTTPTLDKLRKNSLICTNAVSTAAFTQASLHSLMTSTRPLSYGGYDMGVVNRPPTIFHHFSSHNYTSHVLSTFQWASELFGYKSGVDYLEYMFVLNSLVGTAEPVLRSQLQSYQNGKLSSSELAAQVAPFVRGLLDWIDNYCNQRIKFYHEDKRDFPNSRFVNDGYNFEKIKAIVSNHRNAFERDQVSYTQRHFKRPFQPHEYLGAEWRLARHPKKLIDEFVFQISNLVLRQLAPKWASLRNMRFKRYVDGKDLADRICHRMHAYDGSRPWIMWAHFFDTHVPYCAGYGKTWYSKTKHYLEALGYPSDIDISIAVKKRPETDAELRNWSALYDASIRYVDEQVGRIIDSLQKSGKRENTIVVVFGDHGEELGEHGDISHHFRCYSHNVRVPLLINHPSLKGGTIDSLVTLLDLGPTLAQLAGIESHPKWEGAPITSMPVKNRSEVILETVHGGSCILTERPIYAAVRNKEFNFLWKETLDPTDHCSPAGPELFNIVSDPFEQKNIYEPVHPVVENFLPIIANRLAEIPEISDDRIIAAFGEAGQTALRSRQ